MEQRAKKETQVTIAVLLVVVLIVMGAVAFAKTKSKDTSADTTSSVAGTSDNQSPTTQQQAGATADSSGYKDGPYNATGTYSTPENTESITVDVTLKDGTVVATSAKASMRTREAKEYAGDFLAHYKPLVVGQKVDGISLSRVSGSSLTSQGFNSAIDQIKSQAAI